MWCNERTLRRGLVGWEGRLLLKNKIRFERRRALALLLAACLPIALGTANGTAVMQKLYRSNEMSTPSRLNQLVRKRASSVRSISENLPPARRPSAAHRGCYLNSHRWTDPTVHKGGGCPVEREGFMPNQPSTGRTTQAWTLLGLDLRNGPSFSFHATPATAFAAAAAAARVSCTAGTYVSLSQLNLAFLQ